MIPRPENPLIVALDVSDLGSAERLAAALAPHVGMLKVGLELTWAEGPEAVRRLAAYGPMFVDASSAPYLKGMLVDYADGLHGAGFRFTNPNADRTCGCGSSFSV